MKFDLKYVERLIDLIERHSLSEISLNDGEKSVCVKKDTYSDKVVQTVASSKVEPESVEHVQESSEIVKIENAGRPIVSPMVGTFYKAPTVGEKAFVEVGDMVAVGQVVCIVEAMKLMNEIESEVSGRVTKICVEDGQPVEYGQVLMYVE